MPRITISDLIAWENHRNPDHDSPPLVSTRFLYLTSILALAVGIPLILAKLSNTVYDDGALLSSAPQPLLIDAASEKPDPTVEDTRSIAPKIIDAYVAFHKAETLDQKLELIWNPLKAGGWMCRHYDNQSMVPDWLRTGTIGKSNFSTQQHGEEKIYVLTTQLSDYSRPLRTYFRKRDDKFLLDWASTTERGDMTLEEFFRDKPKAPVTLFPIISYNRYYPAGFSGDEYISVKMGGLNVDASNSAFFVKDSPAALQYNCSLAIAAPGIPLPPEVHLVARPALRWIVQAKYVSNEEDEPPYPVIEKCVATTWWPTTYETATDSPPKTYSLN